MTRRHKSRIRPMKVRAFPSDWWKMYTFGLITGMVFYGVFLCR